MMCSCCGRSESAGENVLNLAVMITERLETQLEMRLRMLLDHDIGLPGDC